MAKFTKQTSNSKNLPFKVDVDTMTQKQNTTSLSTLTIGNLSLGNNINWLLLAAVASTFINGLVISLLVFPAVSGPVGLSTGYTDGWAEIAQNIVRGNGFVYNPEKASTFMIGHLKREPVYSLFLAFILTVFGKWEPYMMLFQILINSITCFVLYFIVTKTFNRQVALLGCFFYAFYPFASWYVSRMAYETLLGFLVALLTLGLVNLFERLSFRRALIVGLLLGVTVLCRGIYLLFPLALLPGLVIRFGTRNRSVIGCWVTVVVAMMVVLSPWVLRNYWISREFVPTTTYGGIGYFIGNKIIEYHSLGASTADTMAEREADGMYLEARDAISSQNPSLSHAQVEAQLDKKLIRMAVKHILAHPLTFIEKILKGAILVWFQMDTGLKSTGLFLMQGPLLFLCVIGIFCALKTKKQVLPLLTILLYFVLIQTAFLPYGRYSYPMVPVLIAFAAYALEVFRCKYLYGTVDGIR
jgi:4-amino-4-deoxy-L-arabinose transferase-like glycosyltransferase